MNTNYKIIVGMLAGSVIGAAGMSAIRAAQTKAAPGYVVAEVEVTDPVAYKQYADKVPGTVLASGGHFLIRGGKFTSIEGEPPKRFVLLRFDSVEKAKGWEDSPAYDAIKPIRHNSAKSRVFIIEGAEDQ